MVPPCGGVGVAGEGSPSPLRFAVSVAKRCVMGQPQPACSASRGPDRGGRPPLRARLERHLQGAERAEGAVDVGLAAGQRLEAGRGPASRGRALPYAAGARECWSPGVLSTWV